MEYVIKVASSKIQAAFVDILNLLLDSAYLMYGNTIRKLGISIIRYACHILLAFPPMVTQVRGNINRKILVLVELMNVDVKSLLMCLLNMYE